MNEIKNETYPAITLIISVQKITVLKNWVKSGSVKITAPPCLGASAWEQGYPK